jgi:hypothetical protein
MSYGLAPYGLSSWGFGATASAAVDDVLCIATTVVRVYLSVEPQHSNYAILGDALNPLSWVITDPKGNNVQVAGVNIIDDTTYELVTLVPLTGSADVFTLTWNLLDPSGSPFLPGDSPFYGMTATISSAQQEIPGDLLNPQVSDSANGTLVVGASGDYENEHGAALLRKLIIRRLTSTPGDYFFMPQYGVGVRLKEPVPLSDLASLRKNIEVNLRKEPELLNCRVRLRLDESKGILFISVKTMGPNGREVSTNLEIPQNLL